MKRSDVSKYITMIKNLKLFFVLAIALCLWWIFQEIYQSANDAKITFSQDSNENNGVVLNTVVNPSLYGRTENGDEYTINAENAKELDNGKQVQLTEVNAQIKINDQSNDILSVKSSSGSVSGETKDVALKGNVEVLSKSGYKAVSKSAIYYNERHLLCGDDKINFMGNGVRIEADSYCLDNAAKKIAFKGRVRSLIEKSGVE